MNAPYSLDAMIAELVAAGYEVTFGRSEEGQAEAFIVKDDDTALAHGETHAQALWACSPLHGDDEPYPVPSPAELVEAALAEVSQAGRRDDGEFPATDLVKAAVAYGRELGTAAGARCECIHGAGSHWEIAEPGGPRTGCAILGCDCEAYAPE